MDFLFRQYIYIERDKYLDGRAIVILKTTPPIQLKKEYHLSLMNFIVQTCFEAYDLSKKNGADGFVTVCYLKNLKKFKIPFKFYISFAKLLKRIFNGHLYKCIFVNSPTLLKNIYYIIKRFIDKEVKQKVVFMKNNEVMEDFIED